MIFFMSAMSVALIAAVAYALHYAGAVFLLAIIIPYGAVLAFVTGLLYRVARWLSSPVPFNITTTAGQQKSMGWVKPEAFENPGSFPAVAFRMASEVLLFRSLFRNTRFERTGERLPAYGSDKWLWLGAMAFHWSLFFIILRHFRYVLEPVPWIFETLRAADDLFHIGTNGMYLTNIIAASALAYLVLRRIIVPRVRYISLFQDYALVLLIAGIVTTGMLLRYWSGTDLLAVKRYAIGLVSLRPEVPGDPGAIFYIHITMSSMLAAVIPHSKIIHAAGVFLSPTRNMAGDSRRRRHVNPWNAPVKVHTYGEWEDEFCEKLVKSGYPLEKDNGGKV